MKHIFIERLPHLPALRLEGLALLVSGVDVG